jgi:cell shape-determining protein MreC
MTIHQECANARESALRETIAGLQRENAVLREQIDDWENAVLHARDNRSQEQHCTCVPPLLGKVKQLERENAALRAALDAARKEQP